MDKLDCVIELRAKYVIGYEFGEHVIYKNGCVVYQGDTVLYVGHQYKGHIDESHDQGQSIISPGFIDLDADIDSDHALMDIGVPDNVNKFVMGDLFRKQDSFTDEDFRSRQKFSIAQLIKNGVTTALPITGESYYEWNFSKRECDIMVEIAKEMGMRLYLGPSFKSRVSPDKEDDKIREKRSLEEVYEFSKMYPKNNDSLINTLVNPCQIAVTSIDVLREMAHFAQSNEFPYRLHACEAIREWNHTLPKYGATTIELLHREGMLYDQFIIPHGITVTNNELKILAKTQTTIVNTPLADTNFATALFAFDKYKHYGINMGLGTDTQPTDMIRNLRMTWDIARLCWRRKFFSTYSDKNNGEIIPMLPNEPIYPKTKGSEIFDTATINGAKALGRTDIGRLEKGSKADIIVVTLEGISIGPIHDPIRTLINSCNGNHVRQTIINGRWVMKDRKLIGFDETQILKDAQKAFDRFVKLYKDFDHQNRDIDLMYPPTYKIIETE